MAARNRVGGTALLLAALGVGGCGSLLNPYVTVQAPSFDHGAPRLEDAGADAETLRRRYIAAMGEQAYLSSTTGLVLTAVAGLGLFYAISDAHDDLVAALGIGGGSLYAASRFLSNHPRQYIYAAGANALTCSNAAFDPARAAAIALAAFDAHERALAAQDPATRQATGGSFEDRLVALRATLERFDDQALVEFAPTRVDAGRLLLAEGRQVASQLDEARATLALAPGRLARAVQQVENLVNQALIATEPNLEALADSLGGTIPLDATSAGGGARPPLLLFTPKSNSADRATRERELARLLAALEANTSAVRESMRLARAVVTPLRRGPGDDVLAACRADIAEAGERLTLSPADEMQLSAAGARGVVNVRDGDLPYDAVWSGNAPSANVTLSLQYRPTGAGEVIVEVAAGAPPGRYTLEVTDSAAGRASLDVVIVGGATPVVLGGGGSAAPRSARVTPAAGEAPAAGAPPRPADPVVKEIQGLLNAIGAGGTTGLALDGDFGPPERKTESRTWQAIERELASLRRSPPPDPSAMSNRQILDLLRTVVAQRRLARLGHYDGPVDGDAGSLLDAIDAYYASPAGQARGGAFVDMPTLVSDLLQS